MPTTQYNPSNALTVVEAHPLEQVGEIANHHARQNVFSSYLKGKAPNTRITHAAALRRFADYLNAIGEGIGAAFADFADAVAADTVTDESAWRGVTWGLVEGFKNWMLSQGEAIGTVNCRLSTIKSYSRLAAQAGVLTPETRAMIREVRGYTHHEGVYIDAERLQIRRGTKKAQHVTLTDDQAQALKSQPDTPQGRRDAVLMGLLLDLGLRCGEVARLLVTDVDLKAGVITIVRPKVDLEQTHQLSTDLKNALTAWFESGDALPAGKLLRGSRKGGTLTGAGMIERAITDRVRVLGRRIGVYGLSAHDCRHYWATKTAKRVKGDTLRLQEAGGWASLDMPRRYVERAKIANAGLVD